VVEGPAETVSVLFPREVGANAVRGPHRRVEDGPLLVRGKRSRIGGAKMAVTIIQPHADNVI
jgi:hypothetical protein